MPRLVYLSFLNAAPDATFTLARDHWATEQHIRASGLDFTFLRMNLYMDFIPAMAVDGVIRGPGGRRPRGRDPARGRRRGRGCRPAIRRPRRARPTTSPAQRASASPRRRQLLGARFEDETDEQAYASRASYGAPDWEVRGWVTSYQAIRDGSFDVISPAVRELTGREPTSLAAHLARE